MLTVGVVLFHDNARPHTSTGSRTRALLEHFNWELFIHPTYITDLVLEEMFGITALQQ
jgi:transposase